MSPRGWSSGALVLLAVFAASGRAVPADEGPSNLRKAVERFEKAVQNGDREVQASVAADATLDPFDVAATLYTWYVSAHAEPERRPRFLAALRAWAAQTKERRDAAGLAAVVEGHAALADEVLAGEEERRLAWWAANRAADPAARATAYRTLTAAPGGLPVTLFSTVILSNAASVLEAVGAPEEALTRYEADGRIADALGWRRVSGEAWEHAARIHVQRARWEPAAHALEASAAAFEAMDVPVRLESALRNLAVTRRRLNRFDASLEAVTRAEAIARASGDAPRLRAVRLVRAETLLERGAWDEAEAVLTDLLAQAQAARGPDLGRIRVSLGLLLQRRGRLAEALTIYEEDVARLAPAGPTIELAVVSRNAGTLLRELGLFERAYASHRRALDTYQSLGDRSGVAASLLNLGVTAEALGRMEEAHALVARAVEAERALGDPRATAIALLNFAAHERRMGRAEEGLALVLEAHRTLEQSGQPISARVWNSTAQARAAVGDHDGALAAHLAAVGAGRSGGESDSALARVLGDAAAALHDAGRSADALPLARRCLEARRDALQGFEPAEAGVLGGQVSQVAGLGVRIAHALQSRATFSKPRAAAEAFAFVEWGRALLLGQAVVTRDTLATEALPDDLRAEDRRSRADVERARRTLDEALAAADATRVEKARAALAGAEALREQVGARVHRVAGRAAAVAWPRPIEAAEAARALRTGEVLVLYQFAAGTLSAVVVGPGEPRLVDLGEAHGIEEAAAAWLRLACVPGGPEEELAARLHARLLKPLGPEVASARTLLVSPDGPLCHLPFDALKDTATGRRVVETTSVALVPSATVFAALRAESTSRGPGARVLALGDPTYAETLSPRAAALGFLTPAPLPASGAEARLPAATFPGLPSRVLLGAGATADALRAALQSPGGSFRAVHVACHARVDPERPRLTGLLLAEGQVLDVDDVHRLRCDADLVVLSGCETARGAVVTGEGLLGLTRGFFVAGARRVVASDWKVGDRATLEWMRAFYAGLGAGLAPSEALAKVKRAALARGGEAAHPSAWAAFVLWGLPD